MPLTVSAPSSTLSKSISSVCTAGGFGVSSHAHLGGDAEHALAADEHAAQVVPAGSGSSPPSTVTVPSGNTTSMASTCAAVTPSARQCGPPELLATLPPIEHVCWLLGSGAKCRPCGSTLAREVEVEHARLDPRLPVDRVDREDPFIFVVAMTTAPSSGTAPPARPVPEPRATNGTPWRAASGRRPAPPRSTSRAEHTTDGRAFHVRGVAAVQRQLGRPVAHPVRRAPPAARRRAPP